MGLAEARNAKAFRIGVRRRLESQGERVGLRGVVARIPVSNFHSHLFLDPYPCVSRRIDTLLENTSSQIGLLTQFTDLEERKSNLILI